LEEVRHVADSHGDRPEANETTSAAAAYADPTSAAAALSRGRFLSGVTAGLGGLIGAAVAVPAVGFALGPAYGGEKWYWVDLGPLDAFPITGKASDPKSWTYTPVTFERQPDGGQLARRVVFVAHVASGGKVADDDFVLVSNTCMHLGCPVQPTGGGFACPCHGGQYDKEGRRTAGPPVRPLNRYEAKYDTVNGATHLFIGRTFASKIKNGRVVMSDTWKDPGEPVQGLLSFLYPAPPR
jgi:Rieske Fe-S protein